MSEFDAYSDQYTQHLNEAISFSGDDTFYFADYKARQILSLVDKTFSPKILDYGCGIGNVSTAIKNHAPDALLHGYEVSEDSLSQIPAELRSQGRFSTNLAEFDSDYDLSFFAGVLHHIAPEKRHETLVGVVDRLRVGGKLVAIEHNPWNPMTRWVVDRCPFDKDAVLLAAPETLALFDQLALHKLQNRYIVFFPNFVGFLRPLESHLGWCPLGAQYMVIGVK